MKKQILEFIEKNNLSPFNKTKTILKSKQSIYKTIDSKKIHSKTISTISQNYSFPDTSNILQFFEFTKNPEEINLRQNFFKEIINSNKLNNNFLNKIQKPKPTWKPPYDVIVVTENIDTFNALKKQNCPVQIIVSEQDIALLESREIIQIIDCPEFKLILEQLPQSVFLKSIEEVYLERHLRIFSGYLEILKILNENPTTTELKNITNDLYEIIFLIQEKKEKIILPEEIYIKLEKANEIILEKIKYLNFEGIDLINIISKGKFPKEIKEIIEQTIEKLNIPEQILEIGIPLKIDEEELEKLIQKQNKNTFSNIAETIKENSEKIKKIPEKLIQLENEILFFDFISGINNFVNENYFFPEISETLFINNSKNIFLKNPQPINFNLSNEILASVLTGANSGGKTTLIEHVIQLITLTQIGLPTSGKNKIPLFMEVYYFAKNKGSNLKGAFETLLTQMSTIKPGNKTLILADEIESVTEPGVAGNIIAATIDYYIKQKCQLIIATHLGYEIQKILPEKTRIDGIEAKGLTENFDLIVDHNPVLGKLANSTPELIVEKMANKEQKDYFLYLNKFLKKNC